MGEPISLVGLCKCRRGNWLLQHVAEWELLTEQLWSVVWKDQPCWLTFLVLYNMQMGAGWDDRYGLPLAVPKLQSGLVLIQVLWRHLSKSNDFPSSTITDSTRLWTKPVREAKKPFHLLRLLFSFVSGIFLRTPLAVQSYAHSHTHCIQKGVCLLPESYA